MNKKFIIICLLFISLLFVAAFVLGSNSYVNQPLHFAEEEILFPAPEMNLLSQKPLALQFFSSAYPYVLVGLAIVCLLPYAKKHTEAIKKHLPKVLCVFLCTLCVGTSVTFSVSLADSTFTPISPNNYYGRKQLETMNNSGSLLFAYDQMVNGIENHASEIDVKNPFHSITKDEWKVVLYTYLYDYPQHFWMDSTYRYSYKNGSDGEQIIVQILPDYTFSTSELAPARETFNNKAQEILNTLSPSMSEYELEISIHNQLCDRIVYNEAEHAHTAYGGIVTGIAVCEGYGKAFQYLLNQVGIESTLATGLGQPAGSSTPEDHAWNLVKINGNYYYTDVTWDDQESETYYGYFNMTTAMLQQDHVLANYPYTFPLCTALDENFFTINDAFAPTFDAKQISSLLQYNLKTHVYVTGDASTFKKALFDNSKTILNELNMVTSSNISISSLGREMLICVTGQRRGDVNGDNILNEQDVTLIYEYLNNTSTITNKDRLKAADYNSDGKIDEKDCQALTNYINEIPDTTTSSMPSTPSASSSAVMSSIPSTLSSIPSIISSVPSSSETSSTVSSNITSIPDESSTPSGDEPPNISLSLGDVNGDTNINAKDALLVLRISVNKYTPTQAEKNASDVNKDKSINAKDALEILKKSVNKPACF